MYCCRTVRSQVVVIASGRPLSPSQAAINTSSTPRFFSSENTCSQRPASSPPSPAYMPRISRSPLVVTLMAT